MYRVPAFEMADADELRSFVTSRGAAHLVSPTTGGGLVASVVPLLLEGGSLLGHLARANPHWRDADPAAASLAIFAGPDAYVSPSAYPSKREHGRVVPTWNYEVVHAHGRLVVHDDPDWVGGLVRRLTDRHEAGRPDAWSVDDAPAGYVEGLVRAIVGVELRIDRLEGKRKLSQNRPEADADGVAAQLAASPAALDREVAARMAGVLGDRRRS